MTTHPYSEMFCNKYKAKEQINRLSKIINYTETKNQKVNLNDIIY